MILVLLGTQNNEFIRLLKEIERNIECGNINEEVIVQSGFTKYKSNKMKIFDMISKEELKQYVKKANIVITHGGVGSIQMALQENKKVIAVPRKAQYSEHVNDHKIKNFTPVKYEKKENNIITIIDDYLSKIIN